MLSSPILLDRLRPSLQRFVGLFVCRGSIQAILLPFWQGRIQFFGRPWPPLLFFLVHEFHRLLNQRVIETSQAKVTESNLLPRLRPVLDAVVLFAPVVRYQTSQGFQFLGIGLFVCIIFFFIIKVRPIRLCII